MKRVLRLKITVVIVLIIVFFLVLNFTGFSKETKNFFYFISSPIQKTFWRAGDSISGFLGGIFEMEHLKEEIEKLSSENQELHGQIMILKELEKENEFLREALDIGLEKDFQLELAQVINKDISKDSILINKGLRDGISKGLPVVTGQKTLLGRIGEVYESFSEVILISNEESSFDGKISEKEIQGLVRGKGNLKVNLELIPKEEEILEGDFVITTALGGIFPKGLLVGSIKGVKKLDVEPFQTAEINPSFNLKKLDNLFIITSF